MSEARLEGPSLPLLPARDEHPKSAGSPGEVEVASRDQAAAGYWEKPTPGGSGAGEVTAGGTGHLAAVDSAGGGGVGVREGEADDRSRPGDASPGRAEAAAVDVAGSVLSLSASPAGESDASALRARGVGDGAAQEQQRAMPSRGEHGAAVAGAAVAGAPGRAGVADDADSAKAGGTVAYTARASATGEVGSAAADSASATQGTSSAAGAPTGSPSGGAAATAAVAAAAVTTTAAAMSEGATVPTVVSSPPPAVAPKAEPAAAAGAPATCEATTTAAAATAAADVTATSAAQELACTRGGSQRCDVLAGSAVDTCPPARSPERSANQAEQPPSLVAEVMPAVKTNEGLDEKQQQQQATTTTTTTTRGDPAVGASGATPLHQQQTAATAKDKYPGQSIYHIKWIMWKGESTAIITQNENGPCPLLAIMNVLLLSWKIRFPAGMEIINAEQLMECLGDFILETMPKEFSEAQRLNYEQNISDAMTIMHKLQTGLDVNVRFTGVADFEYTPECIVFDLLGLPLYHGWLVDPQNSDVVKAVGKCSYNQLVEKIISSKQSQNSEEFSEGMVAELFLDSTATQLTYHGLCELNVHVKEAEICVFFRNNHFSTIYKHKGQLFLLVTDQGFLTEESVVWESLHSVDGDGNFCDSDFNLRPPSDPANLFPAGVNQDQIDQDYLVALSLQQEQGGSELPAAESDLDLAKRLQEEENLRAAQYFQEQERQQQQQQQPQQHPSQPPQQPPQRQQQQQQPPSPAEGRSTPAAGSSERERRNRRQEDKSKCVIL